MIITITLCCELLNVHRNLARILINKRYLNKSNIRCGQIRVGRCVVDENGQS